MVVLIDKKAASCGLTLHVQDMAVYDCREALRASTRIRPLPEGEYEEES